MSTWMGVRLRESHDEARGLSGICGQNIGRHLAEVDRIAVDLGLIPLRDFIVDHCGLVEDAWERAVDAEGWARPLATERPLRPGESIPFDPPDDSAYRAEVELWDRVVEDVERRKPWFDPAEGLRTVVGLIRQIEGRLDHPDLREPARLIEAGRFGPDRWHLYPADRERARSLDLIPALGDLRGFEAMLAFGRRRRTLFHLGVSY